MNPLFYTSIDIKRPKIESDSPMHIRIAKVFSLVHHRIRDGQKLAVGFPTMLDLPGLGDSIRIFAESLSDIKELQEFLINTSNFEYIASFSFANPVPEDKVVGYEYYARFRIPCKKNSKKFSKDPEAQTKQEQLRRKRLAMSASLPFVNVRSASTARPFKLFIEKGNCVRGLQGEPDGYGLSRKQNIISLPVFYND